MIASFRFISRFDLFFGSLPHPPLHCTLTIPGGKATLRCDHDHDHCGDHHDYHHDDCHPDNESVDQDDYDNEL